MKKTYHNLEDNILNIKELTSNLWKEKTLILFISTLCALLFYLYILILPKEFKIEFIINEPSEELFHEYNRILFLEDYTGFKKQKKKILKQNFSFDFNTNLLSSNNLDSFFEQNKEVDSFNKFLNKKNISIKQYLKNNKIGRVIQKDKIIKNKYFLISYEELEGNIFINNYIEFTKNKTVAEFENKFKKKIINIISDYELAFELAKEINLVDPILGQNDHGDLFYKGTKILYQQLIYLKKEIAKKNDSSLLDYNPLLNKPLTTSNIVQPLFSYFLVVFILGFFLSLLIIFFRNTYAEK